MRFLHFASALLCLVAVQSDRSAQFSIERGFDIKPLVDKKYDPGLPKEAVKYERARLTQSIVVRNERDAIDAVPIVNLEAKWHQPGGLEGIKGWTAVKYRTLPEGARVKTWIGNIQVLNSFGYYQPNRGLQRAYPDGTRFDEILSNAKGVVFEHRVREKKNKAWDAYTLYENANARPTGYKGLKLACASCHDEAGSGKYGLGLVPGGDTVLSDPLPWGIWTNRPLE